MPDLLNPLFITSAVAIGVPGEVDEYLKKRSRKGLESFVFEDAWGRKAAFVP